MRLLLAAALALPALALIPAPAQAKPYEKPLLEAVRDLPVRAEANTGYDRDSFSLWSDLDGDGCDTREEVLAQESLTDLNCGEEGGEWRSYYDGVTTTDASTLDIDHLVPLAEAYGSGGAKWDSTTKEAYANDLGDNRSLVAVSASSNRSKSDRDPAEWLPPLASTHCRYVTEWVAVKIRWHLSIDSTEKAALVDLAKACKGKTVRVRFATVKMQEAPVDATEGLMVTAIQYDPVGPDTPNGEYVTLTNTADARLGLTGWTLRDEAGAEYEFTSGRVGPGKSVTLYTGDGTTTHPNYYAGLTAWWNNGGDTFYLYDPEGKLAQSGTYNGTGDGGKATFS